jgi:hypothetical protein
MRQVDTALYVVGRGMYMVMNGRKFTLGGRVYSKIGKTNIKYNFEVFLVWPRLSIVDKWAVKSKNRIRLNVYQSPFLMLALPWICCCNKHRSVTSRGFPTDPYDNNVELHQMTSSSRVFSSLTTWQESRPRQKTITICSIKKKYNFFSLFFFEC